MGQRSVYSEYLIIVKNITIPVSLIGFTPFQTPLGVFKIWQLQMKRRPDLQKVKIRHVFDLLRRMTADSK